MPPPPPPSRAPARVVDVAAAARALDDFLRALGHDASVNRELMGTGQRVAEAFAHEFCAGEGVDLDAVLRPHLLASAATGDNAGAAPARVLLRDVPLVTMCPHHLLPAEGVANVAFQPGEHLIGIGAIAAVLETASRRLVLQEVLGGEVLGALVRVLDPRWLVVHVRLAHACMRLRGERAHGSELETWSTHGPVPDPIFTTLGGRS